MSAVATPAAGPADPGARLTLSPRVAGVAPGDILFGCGPIQEVLQYPGQPAAPVTQDQVNGCIHAALEAGIVDFDTAPLYGDSEDRLGHALAASPLGDKAVIYTKAGKLIRRICGNRQIALLGPQPWSPWALPVEERCLLPDFSAAGAKKSYTESCERMGISAVHTLRIHDPDSIEGAWEQAVAPDGLIAGIVQLKTDGLITDVSLGMNANAGHQVVTPGAGGVETTAWTPGIIIDLIRQCPPNTFDSALLACVSVQH
eukprot:COSAG02_NODE_9083_length_2337_cov_3.258210_2_plen_258_part_00